MSKQEIVSGVNGVFIPPISYYFKQYAVEGIGKGADKFMIKRQLIDAFRKEMFDQITFRTRKTSDDISKMKGDPEVLRITQGVVHNTMQRWRKLCEMFSHYVETSGLIKPEDLNFDEEDHA